MSRKKKQSIFIFCMLAWPVLHFIFSQALNLNSFRMAFIDYSEGANYGTFTGLDNFKAVFNLFRTSRVDTEWIAIRNSIIIGFLTVFVHAPMSLAYAYMCHIKCKGQRFFKIVLYMPAIISAVVLVMIFKGFFTSGPLDTIYNVLGIGDKLPSEGWLGPNTAWGTIVIFNIWTGFSTNFMFFLCAMNRIPDDYIEAAKIDGASEPQILFKIILPMIARNLTTILTLGMSVIFSWAMPSMLFMRDSSGMNGTGAIGLSILNYTTSRQYGVAAAYGMMATAVAAPLMLGIRHWVDKHIEDVEF